MCVNVFSAIISVTFDALNLHGGSCFSVLCSCIVTPSGERVFVASSASDRVAIDLWVAIERAYLFDFCYTTHVDCGYLRIVSHGINTRHEHKIFT